MRHGKGRGEGAPARGRRHARAVACPPANLLTTGHTGSSEGSCSEASQGCSSACCTSSRLAAAGVQGGRWVRVRRAHGPPVGRPSGCRRRAASRLGAGPCGARSALITRIKGQQAGHQVDGLWRGGREVLLHVCGGRAAAREMGGAGAGRGASRQRAGSGGEGQQPGARQLRQHCRRMHSP